MLSMGYTICMIVVCAFCTFAERLLPFLIFRKGSVPNSGEISWKYFTGCSDGNFGYLLPSCC